MPPLPPRFLRQCEIYNEHNWAYRVKQELFILGFGELWINQHKDDKDLPVIKQRLLDQSQQLIRSQISASPKCTYYKYLIAVYSIQYFGPNLYLFILENVLINFVCHLII